MNHSKKIRWALKLPTMGLPEGQLSADGTRAYFAVKNGTMIAIDTAKGEQIWSINVGKEFKTDVALYEEQGEIKRVIGLTADGIVHIVDAMTGDKLQAINIGKGSYPAPLYHKGVLYVANHHNIHAFQVAD